MKIVHVAGCPSVEPQEVPGFDGTFPQSLKDSPHSEKEWLAHKDADGDAIFTVKNEGSEG